MNGKRNPARRGAAKARRSVLRKASRGTRRQIVLRAVAVSAASHR